MTSTPGEAVSTSRRARRRRKTPWLAYLVLSVTCLMALFPVFWAVSTSIKSQQDTFHLPPKFFNFDPTFKNYRLLFSDPTFGRIYVNTIVVTLGSTLLAVFAGGLAAYALARTRRFPGRRPFEASLVLVRAMPGIVLMVPLYQIVSRLALYDNRWALIVIYAGLNFPFAVWLMTSFVEQIPVELEESAQIDGAGRGAVIGRVVLPIAMPGIAATMIFVALLSWNEFLIPVLLAGDRARTLPVYISAFISNRNLDWGPMAAASSLAIIPILVITVAMQRRLVSGLSSGAVKE